MAAVDPRWPNRRLDAVFADQRLQHVIMRLETVHHRFKCRLIGSNRRGDGGDTFSNLRDVVAQVIETDVRMSFQLFEISLGPRVGKICSTVLSRRSRVSSTRFMSADDTMRDPSAIRRIPLGGWILPSSSRATRMLTAPSIQYAAIKSAQRARAPHELPHTGPTARGPSHEAVCRCRRRVTARGRTAS
jgi:hypothetical protein